MITIFTYIIFIMSILLIASLGGFIAEKSGVINFAIEGYMILGALTYVFISQRIAILSGKDNDLHQIWIILFISGGVGALGSLLHATASIRFRADQVISSIAFNLLALGIAIFLINTESVNLSGGTNAAQGYSGLLSVGENTSQWQYVFTLPFFVSIGVVVAMIVFYKYSKLGYRIRSVGNNPIAAASVGIKVNRNRFYAVMISGYIGGIAGGLFATYSGYFYGDVQGLGFLAVAIWIFGQWRPSLIVFAASLFGFAFGIARRIVFFPQAKDFVWIPYSSFLAMIPFVISIIVLIIISFVTKRSLAPKAIGVPYIPGGTASH